MIGRSRELYDSLAANEKALQHCEDIDETLKATKGELEDMSVTALEREERSLLELAKLESQHQETHYRPVYGPYTDPYLIRIRSNLNIRRP